MTPIVGPWRPVEGRPRAWISPRLSSFARCAGIAAFLVVYADAPAEEETFGRLFFSAEERSTLDDLRDQALDDGPAPVANPNSQAAVAPIVDVISFDGKVERSAGGTTVWVNGRAVVAASKTAEGISIEPSPGTSGETRFSLPSSDAGTTDFSLKVGQHLKLVNIEDVECFYSENKGTYLHTYEGRNYLLDTTLDHLENELDPNFFFRINRKFFVNINAIKDMVSYTNSRLQIKLNSYKEQEVIVAREHVKDFKSWLE